MTKFRTVEDIHKMNLEHVVVPESKEMLETHTHTHRDTNALINK